MEADYTLSWHDANTVVQEEVICGINNEDISDVMSGEEETDENNVVYSNEVCEEVVVEEGNEQDLVDGQNVMYLTEDNMFVMQSHADGAFMECQVTEEVVTHDWSDCQELVIGSVEQVGDDSGGQPGDDDVMIPLPTDQDQYLASRPYPCDFCSRRFRKKANLMNHMVAHQTDRPHGCNLCGARYIRKCDLMNHLKIHAYVPDTDEQLDDGELLDNEYCDKRQLLMDGNGEPLDRIGSASGGRSMGREQLILGGQGGILPPRHGGPGRKRRRKVKTEYDDEDLMMSNSLEHMQSSGSSMRHTHQRTTYAEHQIMVDEDGNVITTSASLRNQQLQHQLQLQQQQQQEQHHYPITDPRKPFVCQHCGVSFAREKALASHARMHQGDSPFECRLCDEMFWDVNKMREHMRLKHGEGDFHASGQGSGALIKQQTDDDEYSEDEKFGEFFCNECGESFTRSDQLKRHARIHLKDDDLLELDEYMHVCNVCGDSFAEPLDLLAHAECHARNDPPCCSVCSAGFNNQQDLAAHVAAEHAATLPPNACLLCGRICRDKRSLIKHNLEHSREKAFMCPQCSKAFNNRARLKRHLLSHRDKAVTCDVCGQSFPDGRSLMNHRHSHSSVSGRQFPCDECGKSFGSRSSQQIHVRIHTGERPYGCRFCWKAFADGGTLRKHERIHTGEKPYACAVCPRAFNQRVVLREHIRSHHSGPDPNYTHTTTPYCCNVCSDMFATSQDLIVHLIHHCDLNTAMRRQPQVGPRKYKRRRKLKPHELEMANDDDMHMLLDDYHQHRVERKHSTIEQQQQQQQQPHLRHKSAILSGSAGKRNSGGGDSNYSHLHNNTNLPYDEQSPQQQLSNDEDDGGGGGGGTDSDANIGQEHEHEHEHEHSSQTRGRRKIISAGTRSVRKNTYAAAKAIANNSANASDPLNTTQDDEDESYEAVYKSLSSSVPDDTINMQQQQQSKTPKVKKRKEIVATARPKMIHTQKTKISVEMNEGGRVRHKTKTLVTHTQQQQQQQQQQLDDQRIRPRTKNVSYHIMNSAENGKHPLATFPPEDDITAQAVSSILPEPNHQLDGEEAAHAPVTQTITTDHIKQEQQLFVDGDEADHHQQLDHTNPTMKSTVSNANANGRAVRSPLKNRLLVPKRIMDPDTKIVKIIKGGMIISKKKVIRASNQSGQIDATRANHRDVGYVDEPQFIHVKQENVDNVQVTMKVNVNRNNNNNSNSSSGISPLSELAEISMQLQQSSSAGAGALAAVVGDAGAASATVYKCEMCSAIFTERNALLEHVPIHI